MYDYYDHEDGFDEDDLFSDDEWESSYLDTNAVSSEIEGAPEMASGDDLLESDEELFGESDDQIDGSDDWGASWGTPYDPPHWDSGAVDSNAVLGDPAEDMAQWHMQAHDDTCAIVSQEFILDSVLDHDFSEQELVDLAIENGWYTPGGGTTLPNMGRVMEHFNLEVDYKENCSLEDLSDKLENDEKIIVALDSDEIMNPGMGEDEILASFYGIPGQGANHAVQVIGIDNTDTDNPQVIINDPGTPNGKGVMVSSTDFLGAWEDSNNYMVSTTGNTIQSVGNYYDKWGSYYYDNGDVESGWDWEAGWYA